MNVLIKILILSGVLVCTHMIGMWLELNETLTNHQSFITLGLVGGVIFSGTKRSLFESK